MAKYIVEEITLQTKDANVASVRATCNEIVNICGVSLVTRKSVFIAVPTAKAPAKDTEFPIEALLATGKFKLQEREYATVDTATGQVVKGLATWLVLA